MRKYLLAIGAVTASLLAPLTVRAQGILEQMQDEVAGIVGRARPAIVTIEDERVFGGGRGRQGDGQRGRPDSSAPDPKRGPIQPGMPRRPMGEPPKVGSGFSIGDGFIVTTADVLNGMKSPMVLTEDGRRIHAAITGVDSEMNIALLKLASSITLPGLKLGESSRVYPGHFAISIGNQYGHLNSVALTLVAGLRDDGVPAGEHFYPGLIQIAGTVGVGTSGAPILNARGEVVGMIAGIPFADWTTTPFLNMPQPGGAPGSPTLPRGGVISAAVQPGQAKPDIAAPGATPGNGAATGDKVVFLRPPVTSAGFAVPIDDMKPILAGLRQGKLQHCWLGVDMKEERKPIDKDGAVTWKRTVHVSMVYPNSPASAAGFQVGDVLMTVNGRTVNRINIIRATLLRARPGDPLEVRIERKESPQTINARLAARPEPAATAAGSGKH